MSEQTTHVGRFPMERGKCPFAEPAEYGRARDSDGLVQVELWNGKTSWLATRHEDVVAILTDPRFSASPSAPNYPSPTESRAFLLASEPPALGQMDPPDHTRLRRMFAPMFTTRRIESLRPYIEGIVEEALDGMVASGSPADLCQSFAYPIPTTVVATVMGVPQKDREFFVECANARFFHSRSPEEAVKAGERLGDYFAVLLRERQENPTGGGDVVSRLVAEQVAPGNLSREDAIVLLRNLLVNGQDTTANMIALSTAVLLHNPDQLALLKAEPDAIGGAVDELLRYFSNAHFQAPRTALEDVTIAGQTIAKGEGVIASLVAADRDQRVFADPDRLDVRRPAGQHVAFSSGIHSCLGRQLARVELETALRMLFDRLPSLELAVPFEELRFTGNTAQAFGMHELPVAWS
ncbi:cytochrome P450 [Amycolatopsis sp. Poz14]|uniref:cytochrome P450 n=1 Tax=Amycolatopsis sp. Poz14 TaxID=1447705 RepID=UPI001EE7EF31|nr:cytochrome P450 [Amycolatopsis sp. Poz14]MCG3753973.1 cytochrome P450 [Amycolatopsis sp. Poz14]